MRRPAEVEALSLLAAELAHDRVLLGGLDPLGDQVELQRMPEVDDPLEQHKVAVLGADLRRETPVDLDDVDRELAQIRERRVAGAEVVEREDDAELLDRPEGLGDALVGREQGALGELEREQAGNQRRRVECAGDMPQEVGMVELAGRDVDRHLHRASVQLAQAGRFGTRLCEHPLAQADDEPRLFSEWDELAGRELARSRMLPSDERLVAHDPAALEIDHGLVVESELTAGDTLAQLADPLRPVECGAVEVRIEERVADIGMCFRPVHRDVGFLDQRLVVVAEGDADARVRVQRARPAVHRPADLFEQPLRNPHGMFGRERLRENDRELIAAEASGGVAGPDRLLDPLADLLEHLVAEVVAPPVVDRLELVEVDVEQTGRLALLMPELDRVTEALVEEGPVGEAGQRVVEGLLPQLQLGLALARDVEEVALQVERLPVVVKDDDSFIAQPDDSAAAGDEAVLDAERLMRLMRVRMGLEHALT